jgi:hypothetical protein
MNITKDELRAEIATLREELAAERARTEVLREQQGGHSHGCHCTYTSWYWCATCHCMQWPGHACTFISWTAPAPYQVTYGSQTSGGSSATATVGYMPNSSASTLS